MDGYLGNFFEHGGQVVSLAVVALLWLAFSAIGALAAGPNRVEEASPLYGWAVVAFVFTAGGVFTPVPFTYFAVGSAALAVIGIVVAFRRDGRIVAPGSLRIACLMVPLLILVSAMVGSQWDEFSQWLIGPRRVLELDVFAGSENRNLGASHPDYPFSWQLITYLGSRMAGRLVENAGALFNVLLLLSFGLVVVRLIREGLGRPEGAWNADWGLYAIGGLSVTLLNPTFSQKIVLTAYADVAAAVSVGFGGVLGWWMLGRLAEDRVPEARRLAWEIGLVMVVLVSLKQSTIALFALLIGTIVLTGFRDPAVRNGDLLKTLPALVLPGIAIYLAWRYFLVTEELGTVMSVRPVEGWFVDRLPEILWQMLVVFSKKGVYFGIMVIAVGFAVRAMIRFHTPFDRLAVMIGALFLGYNAFLLFAYLSVFGERDALRVASLWRYNMHLGPMGVAFAAYGLALLWKKYDVPARWPVAKAAWLPVVLVLVAPLVFTHKLRFDRHPPVPFFRAVAADLHGRVEQGDRLFVVDPGGSGESAVIARYELANLDVVKGYLGAFHPRSAKALGRIFEGGRFSHLLVHSPTPDVIAAAGLPLEPGTSYLLAADGAGWRVVHAWKAPKP